MIKVILATLASIILLFFLTKLMGNKQIAQMNMFDYVVGITIGSIAAEMATNLEQDTWIPAIAMTLYAVVAFGMSIATNKSLKARAFLAGKPVILMQKGKLLRDGLKRSHLDLNEFLTMARLAGYYDLSQVSDAIFEHNGNVSFLPFAKDRPYTPSDAGIRVKPQEILYNVIMDGAIMDDALQGAGKNQEWLKSRMQAEGYKSAKEILLAIAGTDDTVTFYKNI